MFRFCKHLTTNFLLKLHQLNRVFVLFGVHFWIIPWLISWILFLVLHFVGYYLLKCIFCFFPVYFCRFNRDGLFWLQFITLFHHSILGFNFLLFIKDDFLAVYLLFILYILFLWKFARINFSVVHKVLYFRLLLHLCFAYFLHFDSGHFLLLSWNVHLHLCWHPRQSFLSPLQLLIWLLAISSLDVVPSFWI